MNSNDSTGELIYDQDEPIRLDIFLSQKNPEFSRSQIQHSIEQGNVFVNERPEKSKYKLKKNDLVRYKIVDREIDITDIKPEAIPLEIIFENDDVIVINKQAGLSSHPTQNQQEATLVNALLYYYTDISKAVHDPESSKSRVRAGIAHRLDKDTTGVMIVAKHAKALKNLSEQIRDRKVSKNYLALCFSWPEKQSGRLENYLGRDSTNRLRFTEVDESKGKHAITLYDVVAYYNDIHGHRFSLINFQILTGRTHQIRAQALIAGMPIVGDKVYFSPQSKKETAHLGAKRQFLHSHELGIKLPGETKLSKFTAELPDDFKNILSNLKLQQ